MIGIGLVEVAIVLLFVLVGWFFSITLFIDAAKSKGHFKNGGTGMLWLAGILATPIVVGLYVAALPDLNLHQALGRSAQVDAKPYMQ